LEKLLRELEGEVTGTAARKGLRLEVKPTSAIVESDRELLGRVLRNLLANAVRYTDKGTVTVETRSEGAKLVVSVADTGVGIPPTAQEKVFEEFYQVGNPERDREQGLGLGLSIVRGICRTLEHKLTLISQPQRAVGTEVLVEVPLGEGSLVLEPQPVRPSMDHGFRGRRVLVIDDEKDVRDAMKALLESWNCEPLCAGSFDEASALLAGKAAPDAVVCDYRLPNNMNGVMAIEGLEKQLSRKLPALLVTGDTSPERIREMKQTGHAMLFKPAVPGKLRAALSALLNKP
jgi:CheY-like chemotaxis protein